MSEEEKKAIEDLKSSDTCYNNDVKIVVNLIENQQQELQLKDKVIEEMAGLIYNWDSYRNLGSRKTIVQYFINKVKGE